MPTVLIHDGYTWDGEVPARGPFGAVKFRYRPALPEAVQEYLDSPPGRARAAAAVKLLADHVVSWDVTGGKGDVLPVLPEHLRRLPHPHLLAMLDVVSGYTAAQQEADEKN